MQGTDAKPSYQPMTSIFSAMLAGITCDRWLSIPIGAWFSIAIAVFAIWLSTRLRFPASWSAFLILGTVFAVAAIWHHIHWRLFSIEDLGLSAEERPTPICVEAVALSSARRQPVHPQNPMDTVRDIEECQFLARIVQVRDGRCWRRGTGRARVRVGGHAKQIEPGDRIRICGLVSAPVKPLNPGEPDFASFERAERRLCRIQALGPECLVVVGHGSRFRLSYWLNQVRDHCDANLWRYLSTRRAGLASAVLLGSREQIDPQRNEEFMTTGTVHLLSISGLHVGILAYGFWLMARCGWLSRKTTLLSAITFVILYAMLTDSKPPVVRASVLISVMCAARLLGRQALKFNTLAAAGIVVLVLNPSSFFEAGTQLSFLAIVTMAATPFLLITQERTDPLDQLIAETRPWYVRMAYRCWKNTWYAIGLSTAIWLVALPIVVYRFHLFSPIATILNPIVCIPMGVALFAGFGIMVSGSCVPFVAEFCAWICELCLAVMEECIAVSLSLYGNHVWLPAPPLWWVATFYVAAFAWMIFPSIRPPRRWVLSLTIAWLSLGGWFTAGPYARSHSPGELICNFIAVGHGTSVLMEFPNGKTLLYDAGRLGTASSGARAISSVLFSRGISHLDAVVISHADADHFNAIPELLDQFSVGAIYVSPVMFRHDSEVLSELRRQIQSHNIPIRLISGGDRLHVSADLQASVLHPGDLNTSGSDNSNSLVLLFEYGGRKILLPGDLESPGLDELLHSAPVDVDYLMAPHHGSARSDPDGFASWSMPEVVVISGSLGRDATPVKRAYAKKGARVLHTAEVGAVEIRIASRQCSVRTFRSWPTAD